MSIESRKFVDAEERDRQAEGLSVEAVVENGRQIEADARDEALKAGLRDKREAVLGESSVRRNEHSVEVHREHVEVLDSGAASTLVLLARQALYPTTSADSEFVQESEVGLAGAVTLCGGGGGWGNGESGKLKCELSGEVGSCTVG